MYTVSQAIQDISINNSILKEMTMDEHRDKFHDHGPAPEPEPTEVPVEDETPEEPS